MNRVTLVFVTAALGAMSCGGVARADAQDRAADALAHDIFRELIGINTTDSVGNVTTAAEAMAARLRAAGFSSADIHVAGPNDRKKNLVVRLRGAARHKPLLMLGHLDVVEARRADWSTDPFQLTERDGFFYGRGTLDMKSGDAIMVTTLIRLKQEGFRPDRDIILALTADEEGGSADGVDWLLRNHRDWIDAGLVINHDGYSVLSVHGKPQFYQFIATEKVYADYQLEVTSSGGHSSLPVPQNAIYQLTDALGRLAHYRFPVELNAVTRAYYGRQAQIESGARAADMAAVLRQPPDQSAAARLSRDPIDNAALHTTCVATRVDAGHANNALPQSARAIVNCRILPGHSAEEIRQTLIGVIADPQVIVRYVADNGAISAQAPTRRGFAPAALDPEILRPLEHLVSLTWPGLQVVPTMDAGASDGVYTLAAGMPTYTITGLAIDRDDVRSHGKDERVGVQSFYQANNFFYRYLKEAFGAQ
jgi:acetylornithine deacetylase/succinyl-diaminopimelate desuccinylase-like protein